MNIYAFHSAPEELIHYDTVFQTQPEVFAPIQDSLEQGGRMERKLPWKLSDRQIKAIVKYPDLAFQYAMRIHSRLPEAEPYIMKSPRIAAEYAHLFFHKGYTGIGWPEAEQYIKTNKYAWERYSEIFKK